MLRWLPGTRFQAAPEHFISAPAPAGAAWKKAICVTLVEGRIKPAVARLWEKYYSDYDPKAFDSLVQSHVTPVSQVLEIGAGSGTGQQRRFDLKGKVGRYVGIDLDERVLKNPAVDEAFVSDSAEMPFGDASFDVVFHTMVAEHLRNPQAAMREAARVLKPGGTLLFETPNRFHYPMLAAAITPSSLHRLYVRKLGSGRSSHEVFPTYYRLNDQKAIIATSRAAGLEADLRFYSTPPGYLRFSRAAFLAGVLYERTIERAFPRLRGRILVVARKPEG